MGSYEKIIKEKSWRVKPLNRKGLLAPISTEIEASTGSPVAPQVLRNSVAKFSAGRLATT
jgi:hypothetical protein